MPKFMNSVQKKPFLSLWICFWATLVKKFENVKMSVWKNGQQYLRLLVHIKWYLLWKLRYLYNFNTKEAVFLNKNFQKMSWKKNILHLLFFLVMSVWIFLVAHTHCFGIFVVIFGLRSCFSYHKWVFPSDFTLLAKIFDSRKVITYLLSNM